jgi:predicted  nucleic acid-binding Zn-ribbon protein
LQLRDQIELLVRLREIDDQIDFHENNVSRLPLEVQEIARNLVAIRREIDQHQEKLAAVDKDLRQKERDLAVEQDKIKRSERRLMNIKNQKEYNALSRQVKLGKKVVGEIEDAILEFMSQTETLKRNLDRRQTEYAGLEQGLKQKKAAAEEATREAKVALASLNADKAKIADALEPEYLKRYQVVKKALGNAVAEMDKGTCTACHMAVPPQLNIRILKQEELIFCPSCQRILYVKAENIPNSNKIDS